MSRVDSLLRQGEQAFNQGDVAGAERCFAEAARLAPQAWQIHFNLGMCRDRLGQREGAFSAYEAAHRLVPDHLPVLTNLAVNAFHLGKLQLALDLTLRQVALEPANALAYDNLGQIFRQLGQYEGAELSLRNALLLAPDAPAIHNNLGLVLLDQNKLAEAEQAFLGALAKNPDQVDALVNLSTLYQGQGRCEEALACFERVLALQPQSAVTWTNLGNVLKSMGRYQEALEAQRKAVELAPDYPLAHWNYAISLLGQGQWEAGWREYEWGAASGTRTRFSDRLPRWQGEPLPGRRLLLRSEQGLGDTLQFVRFARYLEGSGANVTLECQAPLIPLLQGQLPGIDRIVPQGNDLPADAWGCDCYLSLMSLPFALGLGTPPLLEGAYLQAPVEHLACWRERLGPRQRPRIGLVWAGNPLHRNDHQRSCSLDALMPLLGLEADFFSLQLPAPAGLPASLKDITAGIQDFADTAAIVSQLDLVVAVDTAIVHLAGALGTPVWLLLARDADWRWQQKGSGSPWYPHLKLYRQKMPGQWLPVLNALAEDLQQALPAFQEKISQM